MSQIEILRDLYPCVHCGLCLQSCPTYRQTGDESEGPRGRIVLMQGIANQLIEPDDFGAVQHLDSCLGCRACEPACPSGVAYGAALEKTRSAIAKKRPQPWAARVLLSLMANPRLRSPFFTLSRVARKALGSWNPARFIHPAVTLLAGTRPHRITTAISTPPEARAQPRRRKKVIVFTGCVMDGLFRHVHDATRRVLRANGYQLIEARGQGCCGALHAHQGDLKGARGLAEANLAVFQRHPDCSIVVNSAGCGAALKEYEDLLGQTGEKLAGRVFDITEFLMEGDLRVGASLPMVVAYDAPCHLEHAQGVRAQPRKLLRSIPDLELIEVPCSDQCCGSAGVYSILNPAMSAALIESKVKSISKLGVEVVTTGNPGCIMQIKAGISRSGSDVSVTHPVAMLDWSYDRAGFYDGVM